MLSVDARYLKSIVFSIFLVLGFNTPAKAGFVLSPSQLPPGGVAMVRWDGSERPRQVRVTFRGEEVAVYSDAESIQGLLGVDMETPPGDYPVEIEALTAQGEEETTYLSLQVTGVERPAERLSLPKQMATPTKPKILKRIEDDRKRLSRIFSVRSPKLYWSSFVRPVAAEIGSPFGLRRILNGVEKSPHNGVDFRAKAGDPVLAAGGGYVAFAGDLYYTGQTVIVDHGGSLFTLYAHLQSFQVKAGETIPAGRRLGRVGSTGRSTGPHLHFGTRLGKSRVDPMALLALYGN